MSNLFAKDAAYVKDGYTFLVKQLEKMDSKIMEPLAATSWPRDMPVKTGGGFVENVSAIDVTYATSGSGEGSLIGEQANDIPVMQADFGKTSWKAINWAHYMRIPYLQEQKFRQIGANIEEVLNKGVRLYFDKTLDQSVYTGLKAAGTTGLLNNPDVAVVSASTGAGGQTDFAHKTPDEILMDVNALIENVWAKNDHAADGLINHILMPSKQYAYLVATKVGTTGDKSILTFLMENNLTRQQGKELVISPCKWLEKAGAGNKDRMVGYINDEEYIRFDLTSPLHRLGTQVENLAFKTPFVGQFSEVQFRYPTTVQYVDGI